MASTGAAPEQLSLAAARERVLAAARPLPALEVPLADALGRALRADAVASEALPPFRNSSMDGFALRAAETGGPLRVVETIAAGHPPRLALGAGEAARIMTGAMMPEGADAVVPVEDAEVAIEAGVECVRSRLALAPGANVREAGRDLAAGTLALPAGRELSPPDLGLLAALGIARVRVGPAPRVAILSTGDELLDIESPLVPGAIRDSNRPMLAALCAAAGAEVIHSGHCGDAPEAVVAAIHTVRDLVDVTLTIGGVSAGDFDPVREGLAAIGGVALWRVAMKPGRPQAFGAADGRLFFGLPGNPASVACVFEVLVRPALRALQGFTDLDRPRLAVRAGVAVESRAGRTDFVRATLARRHGEWWATPVGEQVSGHLAPQAWAHGLLEVPESSARLERGETAQLLLLRFPGASAW